MDCGGWVKDVDNVSDRGLYSPMSGCVGVGRIRSEEFRLAKAGWDRGVFNAAELFHGEVWCRQGVVNALEGGRESGMGQQDGGGHVERKVVVGVRERVKGELEASEGGVASSF